MKNQQQMMKQLQQVQARMAKMQEELNDVTVTGTAGGGVRPDDRRRPPSLSVVDRAGGARGGSELLADLSCRLQTLSKVTRRPGRDMTQLIAGWGFRAALPGSRLRVMTEEGRATRS